MVVIIAGNPVGGFTIYGPFNGAAAATDWADDQRKLRDTDWWLAPLVQPEAE